MKLPSKLEACTRAVCTRFRFGDFVVRGAAELEEKLKYQNTPQN